MAAAVKKTYSLSPFFETLHPHFNKADTKFNAEGLFHSKLIGEGPEAEELANDLEAQSDAALAAYFEEKAIPKGEQKKWTPYYPFEREEHPETGERTGRIIFEVKQNATIRLKDGTTKSVTIGLYDAAGKPMTAPIWSGSIVRVFWAGRIIPMVGQKRVGVRLDFSQVQVKQLAKSGSGGGSAFGAVDGYTEEGAGGFGDSAEGTVGAEY